MQKINQLTLITILSFVIFSCTSEKSSEEQAANDTTAVVPIDTVAITVNDETKFKFDFAIANTPSPVQIIHDFTAFGVAYNNALLHDVKKVSSYNTDFSKSINLGIYNLDLAYAIANNQGADVMKYLKTSMTEADALGLKAAFDQMLGKRAESNISNKDSLLKIIDEIYVKGDSYLRTNDRVQTATHVFIGSWLEALHIMCQLDANEKDATQKQKIHTHVWEQRFYLKNIVELLNEFKNNKEDKILIDELTKIHAEIAAVRDAKDLSDVKFKSISDKISALRSTLTK